MAFRYNTSGKLLLLASPTLFSAVTRWAAAHQQVRPGEKLFGVSITRIITVKGWRAYDTHSHLVYRL